LRDPELLCRDLQDAERAPSVPELSVPLAVELSLEVLLPALDLYLRVPLFLQVL
jgi:hypothetical protein